MDIEYLSASKINTYSKCPQQFWYKYCADKKEDDLLVESDNAELGSAIHQVLDEFNKQYKGKMISEMPSGAPLATTLMDRFKVVWKEMGAHNPELVPIGQDMLANYAMTFKNNLPQNGQILDSESAFELVLESGIPVKGFIDLILKVDKKVWIIDYKTGAYSPSTEELATDVQMSLYDLIALDRYSGAEAVIVGIYNLKYGVTTISRTEKDRDHFKRFLDSVYYSIESDETHEPRINNLCEWCEYKDKCPAYAKVLLADQDSLLPYKKFPTEFAKLVEYLADIKAKIKILEAQEEKLQEVTLKVLGNERQTNVDVPGVASLRVCQNENLKYSPSDIVCAILSRIDPSIKDKLDHIKSTSSLDVELDKYISARKKEVDELIGAFPEIGDSISRTKTFSNPYIRISAPKNLLEAVKKPRKLRA